MKGTEVFIIQLLDIVVAVPVTVFHLEKTGDSEDAQKRVEEVLIYINSCSNCLSQK